MGEDLVLVQNDVLDEFVDKAMILYLVTVGWNGHERRPEADGQIVWVHHVLIAVLRQTVAHRVIMVMTTSSTVQVLA